MTWLYWWALGNILIATNVAAASTKASAPTGDALTLLILLLGLITSAEIATAAAPYALIAIAGFAGAVVKASSMDREWTPRGALWFIVGRVLLALVLTVSVAEIVQLIAPAIKPRYSFSIIAFALAGYYEEIRDKVPDMLKALIPEKWKGGNSGN